MAVVFIDGKADSSIYIVQSSDTGGAFWTTVGVWTTSMSCKDAERRFKEMCDEGVEKGVWLQLVKLRQEYEIISQSEKPDDGIDEMIDRMKERTAELKASRLKREKTNGTETD